jgi:hypothetical protein
MHHVQFHATRRCHCGTTSGDILHVCDIDSNCILFSTVLFSFFAFHFHFILMYFLLHFLLSVSFFLSFFPSLPPFLHSHPQYCVKAVPLQAWGGPEGSRKLRFPDFMTTAQYCGKVVSPTHRPPLPPGNIPGTHFC